DHRGVAVMHAQLGVAQSQLRPGGDHAALDANRATLGAVARPQIADADPSFTARQFEVKTRHRVVREAQAISGRAADGQHFSFGFQGLAGVRTGQYLDAEGANRNHRSSLETRRRGHARTLPYSSQSATATASSRAEASSRTRKLGRDTRPALGAKPGDVVAARAWSLRDRAGFATETAASKPCQPASSSCSTLVRYSAADAKRSSGCLASPTSSSS